MTKTQYYTATTLDGYIADERNSLDWLFDVDRASDGDGSFGAFFAGVGAMAMGATTYEWIVERERVVDDPDRWRRYYGDVPCWVFTHRDLPAVPTANVHFVQGDVRPVHEEMTRAAGGRNVWLVGGGDLVGPVRRRGSPRRDPGDRRARHARTRSPAPTPSPHCVPARARRRRAGPPVRAADLPRPEVVHPRL